MISVGIVIIIILIVLIMKNKNTPVQNVMNDSLDTTTNTSTSPKRAAEPTPAMELVPGKTYSVVLSTTEGDITIELDTKNTPITANNFVALARKKFYDRTIFHRVIEGFMIQGGDPLGNGTGDPGYRFDDEPVVGEYTRGTVAMANSGPNTNGSQFFIMHKDTGLQKDYVIFGKVTEGMDVVDKIATAEVKPGGEGSTPVNPVTINSVEVIEK